MDYKKLAADLLSGCEENCANCEYAGDSEFECTIAQLAATAITDLLARAEAAEARVKNLSEALERERRRAEKAEMERDAYKIFFDDVSSKPDCNTCCLKQCEYRPEIGQTTRFNCPLWRGQKED